MEEAVKELSEKQQAQQKEVQDRLKACGEMIQTALQKTNCRLTVNPESTLNNLQIIVAVNQPEQQQMQPKK